MTTGVEGLFEQALQVLRSTFGYPEFRGHQAAAIRHLLAGEDALVLMPTGGGKSLCYQIPGIVRPGTAVVVSPLIALMQNQVDRLHELGVRAAYLNSTLSSADAYRVQKQLRAGALDILYVAPERLLMDETLALLRQVTLSLIAVDEAHCISSWGHDFRKDYLELSRLASEFPQVPRVALTATADERTRVEIVDRLRLRSCKVFVSSFNRPNICYRIAGKDQPKEQLLSFVRAEHEGHAGIVYCLTRNDVEATAAWLSERGLTAIPYHAGLSSDVRARHLDRFLQEDGIIVVATIAFGMGIDKPDVRFVAHLDLPKNLEAYYQETGRAGRDGLPADAWMVYGIRDVIMLRQLVDSGDSTTAYKRIEQQKIQTMLAFCESTSCRRQALLRYFGEHQAEACGNCDTCLAPTATWDATTAARMGLSCIYRTGQRFGVNHLIDVLLGAPSPRLSSFGHDRVSTFGIGTAFSETVWRSVFRGLIAAGLARVDEHGALQLAPGSGPLLKGEASLHLRQEAPRQSRVRKKKRADKTPPVRARQGASGQASGPLREALSKHRLMLARKQNLPPYCILQNTTLEAMATLRPQTLQELRAIPGIGDVKLAKYGESFLELIRKGDLC